jgi:hypothetical protein
LSEVQATRGVFQWADIPDIGKVWLDTCFKQVESIEAIRRDCILHHDFGVFRVRAGFANQPGFMFWDHHDPKWHKYTREYWALDSRINVWHYIKVNRPEEGPK